MNIKEIFSQHPGHDLGQGAASSVLLPLLERDGQVHLLYEVRSGHISLPYQTAFPGGRLEEGETPEEAAVRETSEELNLHEKQIEVFGPLLSMPSFFNSRVYSYVGYLHDVNIAEIKPNDEVHRVFTLPLDLLLEIEPETYTVTYERVEDASLPEVVKEQIRPETQQEVLVYPLEEENLWGMSAVLTAEFVRVLRAHGEY